MPPLQDSRNRLWVPFRMFLPSHINPGGKKAYTAQEHRWRSLCKVAAGVFCGDCLSSGLSDLEDVQIVADIWIALQSWEIMKSPCGVSEEGHLQGEPPPALCWHAGTMTPWLWNWVFVSTNHWCNSPESRSNAKTMFIPKCAGTRLPSHDPPWQRDTHYPQVTAEKTSFFGMQALWESVCQFLIKKYIV